MMRALLVSIVKLKVKVVYLTSLCSCLSRKLKDCPGGRKKVDVILKNLVG